MSCLHSAYVTSACQAFSREVIHRVIHNVKRPGPEPGPLAPALGVVVVVVNVCPTAVFIFERTERDASIGVARHG